MTIGRRGEKTYTGHNGAATDVLRAKDKLRKMPEGTFGRTAPPFEEQVRACIEAGLCPWCNAGPFKVLATHVFRAHAVTGIELREMAGIVKTASICDPAHAAAKADALRGQRLPDSAYERNKKPRRYSKAGLAVQRAKLESARSPEQARAAGVAAGAKIMAENEPKYQEIKRLFGEGMLFRDIASAVGMTSRTVRTVLHRAGLVEGDGRSIRFRNQEFAERAKGRLRRGLRSKLANDEAMALARLKRFADLGGTWHAVGIVASEWGTSKKSAAQYLKNYGVQVPDGRVGDDGMCAAHRAPAPRLKAVASRG